MRIIILTIVLLLTATPSLAREDNPPPVHNGVRVGPSHFSGQPPSQFSPGPKVIIKGKGGKVYDVEELPKNDKRRKPQSFQ